MNALLKHKWEKSTGLSIASVVIVGSVMNDLITVTILANLPSIGGTRMSGAIYFL